MYNSVTYCQVECSIRRSEMIDQATPRAKNEMPYGRGVLLGEEHVTTQSSLSNIGTTLFTNSLATTCFGIGWRWICTPQEECLEARCNREDYPCKDRPRSGIRMWQFQYFKYVPHVLKPPNLSVLPRQAYCNADRKRLAIK